MRSAMLWLRKSLGGEKLDPKDEVNDSTTRGKNEFLIFRRKNVSRLLVPKKKGENNL